MNLENLIEQNIKPLKGIPRRLQEIANLQKKQPYLNANQQRRLEILLNLQSKNK